MQRRPRNWRTMNIVPKNNFVVLEYVEPRTKLVLPDGNEASSIWEVIAVGDGRRLENGELVAIDLEVGDEVIIADGAVKLTPTSQFENRKLVAIDAQLVIAKIEQRKTATVRPSIVH